METTEGTMDPIAELKSIFGDEDSFYARPELKEKLVKLFKKLEDQNKSLAEVASTASEQKKEADQKLKIAVNDAENFKIKLAELQQNFDTLTKDHAVTSQKKDSLEQKQIEMEQQEKDGRSADLIIETNSLFELNEEGWSIKIKDKEKFSKVMKEGLVFASVLGDFDTGKSFLLNELGANFDSGFSKRTNAISVSIPEEEGKYYALVDTPGSKEAIQAYNKEILAKVLPNIKEEFDNQTLGKDDKSKGKSDEFASQSDGRLQEEESKRDQIIRRYLLNDRKIIDNLKEKFIIEYIDMIFIVVGKLSESEDEMIQRNVNYFEKLLNSNSLKMNKRYRNKKLYVIHNFKMLKTIEAVETQMEKDIFSCFKVKKNPMFNDNPFIQEKPNYNKYMYTDSRDINHIVLAAKGTEAGDYYNTPAIRFLKQKLMVADHKSYIDFPKDFLEFCKRNLPAMVQVQQQDLNLEFDQKKGVIVQTNKKPIKIGRLYITDIGDLYAADTYVPGYSKCITKTEDDLIVTIDAELLDCQFEAKLEKQGGRDYITIRGEKKVFDDASGALSDVERFNHSRLVGRIYLSIPLLEDKDRPKVKKDNLNNGIWRFTVTYSNEDKIII